MEVLYSKMPPIITILLIVNLLLVGLAWWNFKETRRLIQNATEIIHAFLKGDSAAKLLIAVEKVRIAEEVRTEFLGHKHNDRGEVV